MPGGVRKATRPLPLLAPLAVADEADLEPAHPDQIVNAAPQAIADAVFRNAGAASAVTDAHLHDARPAELAERGQESMHADEHRQTFQHLAAVGLERAADVGDAVTQRRAPHRIRDAGGPKPHP